MNQQKSRWKVAQNLNCRSPEICTVCHVDFYSCLCYTLSTVREGTKVSNTDAILASIQAIVATMLGRVSVTWDEVEEIYASGEYPKINEAIDYIVG